MAEIIDFVPTVSEKVADYDHKYDEDVQTLIGAGEGKALKITVTPSGKPTKDGKSDKGVEADKRAFQAAAKAADKSARLQSTEVLENGDYALVFTLGKKVTRPRKATSAEGAEGATIEPEATGSTK